MKVGILGAGDIASTMATAINGLDDSVIAYAVASRSLEKAEAFAKDWKVQKAYGSYEEMLEDPEVDLVYVATPHNFHYEHTKMCIMHGKAALVEKPFTVNEKEAAELFTLAGEKGVMITEAIWTRYQPARKMVNDTIASGIIGEPLFLRADLSYSIEDKGRMTDPNLAGGALLDLGVYVLNFASMFFGDDVKKISGTCAYHETGVDAQEQICVEYTDGRMAALSSSFRSCSNRMGVIQGTKGYIEVENVNNPQRISVYDTQYRLISDTPVPEQINGYEYEVLVCKRVLEEGGIECPEMPHAETLLMMREMDGLRADWGIKYPFE